MWNSSKETTSGFAEIVLTKKYNGDRCWKPVYIEMIRCLILFNLRTLPKINLKILNQIILKREMDVGTVIEQHDWLLFCVTTEVSNGTMYTMPFHKWMENKHLSLLSVSFIVWQLFQH